MPQKAAGLNHRWLIGDEFPVPSPSPAGNFCRFVETWNERLVPFCLNLEGHSNSTEMEDVRMAT